MKKAITVIAVLAAVASIATAAPVKKIAVSEYPSWSAIYLTANDIGLINGDEGKMGPLEKQWGIDLVVLNTDYDSCITLYVNGDVDASCLTNIDSLAPSVTRKSVVVTPTSTSAGADACIVVPGITSVTELKGKKVRGLSASVSEYAWDFGLKAQGEDPKDYTFENLDPVQVGVMLQDRKIEAGVTWNPVVMETLKADKKLTRLFDSSLIKGHIIDGVTVDATSLEGKDGHNFGCLIADIYFKVVSLKTNPANADKVLGVMGQNFTGLGLKDMRVILRETELFETPEKAITFFEGKNVFGTKALPAVMSEYIIPWTIEKGLVEAAKVPTVAYGSDHSANLTFDSQYIKAVTGK